MTKFLLNRLAESKLNSSFYEDLKRVGEELESTLSQICFTEDLQRAVMSGGKRLRPNLAYTAYRLGSSDFPIVPLMVMIELMHSASLIHDDIVDSADIRRGVPTINASSGDYAAAQSADYLLSRAMEYLYIYKGTGIDERLAEVSARMCLGEFDQIRSAYRLEADSEEKYFGLIQSKTAFFIGTAAACGGIAGGLNAEEVESLEMYGRSLGTAFQIRDDVLDYDGTGVFGKKKGQDLDRGLYTLPLLFAMKNDPELTEEKLRSGSRGQIIDSVRRNGISDCQKLIEEYSDRAITSLAGFPDSHAKEALVLMAESLKNRIK